MENYWYYLLPQSPWLNTATRRYRCSLDPQPATKPPPLSPWVISNSFYFPKKKISILKKFYITWVLRSHGVRLPVGRPLGLEVDEEPVVGRVVHVVGGAVHHLLEGVAQPARGFFNTKVDGTN